VLAGGSPAAAWKAELLSASGARVDVYATDVCDELQQLASGTAIWHDLSGTGPELSLQYRHAAKPAALSA